MLITSRRHLADLPGAVIPVLVEVLPPGQAAEMFVRLAPRAAADPAETVAELVRLAGYLPLAISLLARVYDRHTAWGLADLIRETETGLLTDRGKDSVVAAFEVSYRHLNPGKQRFFRSPRPGIWGPRSIVTPRPPWPASRWTRPTIVWDTLHREGLLTEVGHRRYGMHDLIRGYAGNPASDPAPERSRGWNGCSTTTSTRPPWPRPCWPARSGPVRPRTARPPAAVPDLPDRQGRCRGRGPSAPT